MGLGFGARGEMMWLENGDGGRDRDSLLFYVAITLLQMPLSEIDGVVNLFFVRRAKERHLIFGACWRDCLAQCEIKFSGHVVGTAQCGAHGFLSFDYCLRSMGYLSFFLNPLEPSCVPFFSFLLLF